MSIRPNTQSGAEMRKLKSSHYLAAAILSTVTALPGLAQAKTWIYDRATRTSTYVASCVYTFNDEAGTTEWTATGLDGQPVAMTASQICDGDNVSEGASAGTIAGGRVRAGSQGVAVDARNMRVSQERARVKSGVSPKVTRGEGMRRPGLVKGGPRIDERRRTNIRAVPGLSGATPAQPAQLTLVGDTFVHEEIPGTTRNTYRVKMCTYDDKGDPNMHNGTWIWNIVELDGTVQMDQPYVWCQGSDIFRFDDPRLQMVSTQQSGNQRRAR